MLNPNKMRGITLMELMIVVVIVGILAAIAFPNYRAFVERATRNEAKAALLQVATNQEKWYLQNNEFTLNLADLGLASDTTDSGKYVIGVASGNVNATFTATATYQGGGQELGKCETFTIDAAGVKGSLPAADCWTRTR